MVSRSNTPMVKSKGNIVMKQEQTYKRQMGCKVLRQLRAQLYKKPASILFTEVAATSLTLTFS